MAVNHRFRFFLYIATKRRRHVRNTFFWRFTGFTQCRNRTSPEIRTTAYSTRRAPRGLELFGAVSLGTSGAAHAACTGPGAPTNTQTQCLTAVQIPGNPLRSYDISWVNPDRAEYYLADRSNAGIDIINTFNLTFKRTLGKGLFVGVVLNPATGAVDNDHSGPDGVVTHGRWLYAGDGDSTLKVFDLNAPNASALKQLSTGGEARVDEMALTTDGKLLLTVNNADDPPFATLFAANGDRSFNSVREITKITIDATIFPGTPAIEQPAWDPKTERFYVSVPILGENPRGPGCTTCDGGLMVIDPTSLPAHCDARRVRPGHEYRRPEAQRLRTQRCHGRTA